MPSVPTAVATSTTASTADTNNIISITGRPKISTKLPEYKGTIYETDAILEYLRRFVDFRLLDTYHSDADYIIFTLHHGGVISEMYSGSLPDNYRSLPYNQFIQKLAALVIAVTPTTLIQQLRSTVQKPQESILQFQRRFQSI